MTAPERPVDGNEKSGQMSEQISAPKHALPVSGRRPLVTVITPAYNVEKYLGEAIDSVLGQTFTDFEYLIVDDGSTDRTADEARVRAAADPRLQLLSAGHGGAAAARNVGIARAQGDYIAFLDSDDRWHRDFLAKQLALIQSAGPDVAAVFARSTVMSETGRIYALRWQRSGRYDFDDMLVQSCPPRTGSSLLIRKRAFDVAGPFTSHRTIQDLDTWLKLMRDSGMPYFWGGSAYLLDIRVRSGAISRDLRKRFEDLDVLISERRTQLRRHPEGMAYVRAAVFAFRAGADDFALRWSRLARQAGLWRLVRDSYGRRMLGWCWLGPAGRNGLRRLNGTFRMLVGRAVGARGGLLR
jgi:glycosyltransferase involved in cell wall biosynthesis